MSYYIYGFYKMEQAESNPGAGEPISWGERQAHARHEIDAGGLLYPSPAANLVGE